jgi:adhesin/invasin
MTETRDHREAERARARLPAGLLLSGLVLAGLLGGCENVAITEVEVTAVGVSPSNPVLVAGQSVQLTAVARDAAGRTLPDRTFSWSAVSPGVASVNPSGLVQGLSEGITEIRATTGGVTGTASVRVDPPPQMAFSPADVLIPGVSAAPPTPPVQVQVTNSGGGALSGLGVVVDYGGGPGGWLEASLSGTTAPATLTLRGLPAELPGGRFEASVRVTASSAPGATGVLPVALELEDAPPVVRVTPTSVGFASSDGQAPPPLQEVQVTNAGGGTLGGLTLEVTYLNGATTEWLSAELSGTTAPATLALRADPEGLATGVLDARVRVRSTSAPGDGAVVSVRFRFGDPPPQIELRPPEVEVQVEEGTSADPVVVEVDNAGAGALTGLSAALVHGSVETGWVTSALAATVAPTTLDLAFPTAGLLPGTYDALVRVSADDAINSPTDLGIVVRVLPRPVAQASSLSASPDTLVADGTSTSLLTVTLRDARNAQIPFGGDDVVFESSAGTLGPVTDLADGRYRAVLTAPTEVGVATVTARLRGVPLPDTVRVALIPGPVSADGSTLEVAPDSITTDGSATVYVQLRDAAGNPLTSAGDAVFLATSLGTLTPSSGTTNASGQFEATLTSTTPGTASVTAHLGTSAADPVIGTVEVTVTPGAADPDESTVGADPLSITTDGSSTVTVQLRDAAGNPLTSAGDAVFLATSLGTLTPSSGTSGQFRDHRRAPRQRTVRGTVTLTSTIPRHRQRDRGMRSTWAPRQRIRSSERLKSPSRRVRRIRMSPRWGRIRSPSPPTGRPR